MRERKTLCGLVAMVAATTSLLVVERVAQADEREQCAAAADQAQQLRDEGKYRRAREQLLLCARDACPAPIKRDCLDWLGQVEQIAPTIVLSAKDGGKDISEVKVSIDGAAITERLDGKPLQMDLGKHTIKFEYSGQTKEEEVIVGAGQKNRTVSVTFGAGAAAAGGGSTTPPDAGGGGGSLVPALVVGGIGVVGLASFTIFGLSGKSAVDDLQSCKPRCAQTDVDKARTKLIIADISLGVGLVALGVATYMILTRPKIDVDVKGATKAPVRTGFRVESFDVAPLTGGAMGSVGTRF